MSTEATSDTYGRIVSTEEAYRRTSTRAREAGRLATYDDPPVSYNDHNGISFRFELTSTSKATRRAYLSQSKRAVAKFQRTAQLPSRIEV